jgi:hypothetical protein
MAVHADDQQHGPSSRRAFLTKAAVGGAIVWAAPVVMSRPALAGPSCASTGSIVWPTSVTSIPSGYTTTGGTLGPTVFTLSYADPTSAVTTSAVDATFARGVIPMSYHMQLGDSGAGPVAITLSFAPAVYNLRFAVLDVDWSGSATGWRDEINVRGFNGATPTAGTGTPVSPASITTVTPNERFRGLVNIGNSAPGADVGFVFAGPITTVTIDYIRAGATQSEGIGISGLTWCH